MEPRLKSLELLGYKTFASRVNFEFLGSKTAIVGPNGSGKSNIADAIRWVLGEQSYSLLRGRKTEDMIFSGSELRPRASMASVSITFNNDDNWLPIDYSEVSITRRAYRDGQNEYLLNGQKVRLKEISELLSQSGLAERTYTIIGQGLVDAALSLRADERRRFFEEAAGIGLYRRRRDEAVNRLADTRRNLVRVADILSEIEPRLQSLEKQAKKVQEHEHIKAELRSLLRDWYGYHWHRAQQQFSHGKEVFRVQTDRLSGVRKQQSDVERLLNKDREQIQEIRVKLNQWHSQSSDIHKEREKTSKELAVLNERHNVLINQKQILESDIGRFIEECNAQEEKLKTYQDEHEQILLEKNEAQKEAQEAEQKLSDQQNEHEKILQHIKDKQNQSVDYETRLIKLNAHLSELGRNNTILMESRQVHLGLIEHEEKILKELHADLILLINNCNNAQNELEKIEQEAEELRNELEKSKIEADKILEERSQTEIAYSSTETQFKLLKQAETSMMGLNQGARYILKEANEGRIKGKIKALSRQIDVSAEYETAIVALLGDFIDGIILGRDTDPELAISALENGENGRTILLPVEHMHEITKDDQQLLDKAIKNVEKSDFIGHAREFIKLPKENEGIIDLILGQSIIVRNRAAARGMIKELPAYARVVTLKGEVFWGNGVIVAGKDGREEVISRRRQISELKSALHDHKKNLAALDKRLENLGNKNQELLARSKKLDDAWNNSRALCNKAMLAKQHKGMEIEQAEKRRDWQKEQVRMIDSRTKSAEDDVRETEKEIEHLNNELLMIKQEVQQLNQQAFQFPLGELQVENVHWTTKLAVMETALKSADERIEEHQLTLDSYKNELESLKSRYVWLSQEIKSSESHKDNLLTLEQDQNNSLQNLIAQIEPAEKQLEMLEITLSKHQADQQATQQAYSLADRNATQSQLEMIRCRDKLDSLRKKIEDDFGLVAFEYATSVTGPTPLPLEGLVENLPIIEKLSPDIEDAINYQKSQLRRLGAINPEAQNEYQDVLKRYEFLNEQIEDLTKADDDLNQVIDELNELMRQEFQKTFTNVAEEFKTLFVRLFGGGSAKLLMTDEENISETGIDIEAILPGRREHGLAMLSGGERSLTAVALIFSLLKVSPTPFCVLDEVDAMLDESNVGRFCELLQELSEKIQFIVVTHNRSTVQAADVLYGVTMGRDSSSQVISLKLDEISDELMNS